MLHIVDLALVQQIQKTTSSQYDSLASSHILSGIEFVDFKEQREKSFEKANHISTGLRTVLFTAASVRSTSRMDQDNSISNIAQGFPSDLLATLQNEPHESLFEAVCGIVAKKISILILLPIDQMHPHKMLRKFSLGSMLAAKFRTFIFRSLGVDVPFMRLLDKKTTISTLGSLITEALEVKRGCEGEK